MVWYGISRQILAEVYLMLFNAEKKSFLDIAAKRVYS